MNAKETVAAIKAVKTLEELNALKVEGEARATVLEAFDTREEELKSDSGDGNNPPEEHKLPKGKNVLIEFVKSPTGAYKLGYSIGDRVEMNSAKAQDLIDAGYAKLLK